MSGESGWQPHSFQVPPGTNTLEWRYLKGASSFANLDAVFVDNVDVPLVEPVDLGVPVRVITNSVELINGTDLRFRVQGQSNQVYRVQASSDLANWVTLSTNYAPYGLIQFTDPQGTTNSTRYYRVVAP